MCSRQNIRNTGEHLNTELHHDWVKSKTQTSPHQFLNLSECMWIIQIYNNWKLNWMTLRACSENDLSHFSLLKICHPAEPAPIYRNQCGWEDSPSSNCCKAIQVSFLPLIWKWWSWEQVQFMSATPVPF